MALESGSYLSDLVITNPTATDSVAQADDHLRLIKTTLTNSFPGITGAVTATHTELSVMDGNTAASTHTLANTDQIIINDAGTMKQVDLTTLTTYLNTTQSFFQNNSAAWSIVTSASKITFEHNGIAVFSVDTSGNVVADQNITAYGTP